MKFRLIPLDVGYNFFLSFVFVYGVRRQETLKIILTKSWPLINYFNFLGLGMKIFLS